MEELGIGLTGTAWTTSDERVGGSVISRPKGYDLPHIFQYLKSLPSNHQET
jgi:hypothetical protein